MARLVEGERKEKESCIVRLLRRRWFGMRESEIAEELGWERRTVNNYLRGLKKQERVYKEGRDWLADE
ncbi:MAG: helix-turn-helix domain-containing protein [Anaerolineae bacterium]|nr:helix-turn-helix domain-containing protein [Anaerolineae bacterium]